MLRNQYTTTTYPIRTLVDEVAAGRVGLPELQRPFVWKRSDVRDLLDSLYQGFPVGQIMTWATGAEARQIGTTPKDAPPTLLLVDGQQRVTSLFAVLHGAPVIDEDYREVTVKIAFNPMTGKFDTQNAAIRNNPEWVDNVTDVFQSEGLLDIVSGYLDGLAAQRGEPADAATRKSVQASFQRLYSLPQITFDAVQLLAECPPETVAEVFVRINNKGKRLDAGNFLLTLMTVYADKDRKRIEEWVRDSKKPPTSSSEPSPFNHHHDIEPEDLVRAASGLAFRRGRLKSVYQFLRAGTLDAEDGQAAQQGQDAFAAFSSALDRVLNIQDWHQFLQCVDAAGFRSKAQISSGFAMTVCWTLFMHGRATKVPQPLLKNVIARWFFMSQLTGRYSGSSETQFTSDLQDLTADGVDMVAAMEARLAATLTEDFWTVTLLPEFEGRSWQRRSVNAYEAAQVVRGTETLFDPSGTSVAAHLTPSVVANKGIERHHLFPRAYLRSLYGKDHPVGVPHQNHPANVSFVAYVENIDISDRSPAEYWPEMAARLAPDVLKTQMEGHALWDGWHELDYSAFIDKRMSKMSAVVRDGYARLVARRPNL